MSATVELTQRHRAQQLLLRRETVTQMTRLWPALDWSRLDATYSSFALSVARMVDGNRQTSSGLASQYLRAFRKASNLPGEVKTVFAKPVDLDQFRTSLSSTSLGAIKRSAGKGVAESDAMKAALALAQGAMARLVLNAGRETILGTIATDSAALGWQRVLGGAGCEFCVMLAGRGAVYKEDTVDFAAHDHCGCSVAPEYGDTLRSVGKYVPSTKNISDADRARVRSYLSDHPNA